jgi:hypothetical protein
MTIRYAAGRITVRLAANLCRPGWPFGKDGNCCMAEIGDWAVWAFEINGHKPTGLVVEKRVSSNNMSAL